MILKAVKPSPKSAGSKSSKDTYQKIGPHKKPSIEAEGEKARRTIQASNGRKNLLSSSDARQHPLKDREVAHAPEDSPATPTFAYDKRLNTEFKWFTRTLR
jgi:hypothetical protein